ncbi:uncharacterized protein DS421_13g418500 [Arachis hypogaea]|nr:uncharacterized protein DS421_13g418500 [Arachis hypogaea]
MPPPLTPFYISPKLIHKIKPIEPRTPQDAFILSSLIHSPYNKIWRYQLSVHF